MALDLGPDGMTRAAELVTERTAELARMFDGMHEHARG
jgi:hypothetical protein